LWLTVQPTRRSTRYAVRHAQDPGDVLGCVLPKSSPQVGLVDIDDLAGMPLGAAVLAYHLAGKPLRYPDLARRAATTVRSSSGLRSFPPRAP